MTFTFRSFCSGIGAPEQAWKPLGFRCLSTSEIDQRASSVLAYHNAESPNIGNMEEINDPGYADVFVAGTPCQSFSVAGLRKGMEDPRGNLALVFLRLVDRGRPRRVVWENVPGVLSSNGGRDFGAFLGGLAELGYGWAYRILDAQYVRVESHARAVPQRRRRVFVVGCLGGWQRAGAVLLERQSLCGHPSPRRTSGKGTAADTSPSLRSRGPGSCRIGDTRMGRQDWETETFVASKPIAFHHNARADEQRFEEELCGPVTRGQQPAVMTEMHVRRLTPRECERLQGFPDDYTLVPYKGKPMSDASRYRMLGNSMAVNVMSWIGQRLKMEMESTQ